MGLAFEVIEPRIEEIAAGSPREVAERLAAEKAREVAERAGTGIVIGCDTIVSAAGEILGKPRDAGDARRILSTLSDTRHAVITGVCVLDAETGRERIASERTYVTMRSWTEAEIDAYVSSGEAMGKAGAYAIQETGDRYVVKIEGSFNNVVGLPTELLARILTEFGIRVPNPAPDGKLGAPVCTRDERVPREAGRRIAPPGRSP